MAIRDVISRLFGQSQPSAQIEWLGPAFREMVLGLSPEELYRTQPYLRIVLDFVARNVAHLGLQAFERVDETDRRRLRDDPIAQLIRRPNEHMTRYELFESLVLDLGLYDAAYWVVTEDIDAPSGAGWTIQPIPPSWVRGHFGGGVFAPAKFILNMPDGSIREVDSKDMLVFHGWNPGKPKKGSSPVETLKQVLAEQVQAWSYREQVWQRGGRAGTVITRPAGATWSDAARERFVTDWKSRWTGQGARAGGTPILEDGMTINQLGFSAREEEWAEVAKVALSTVASVFHVNPVMVGILDNANFSNTKEFRKMLYSETLGPLLAMIEDRLNTFLVPRVSSAPGAYLEFNIAEKLQGDFEEQASILSTSTGAPWMTRNEARARQNLPRVEGGDELVTPLNVLIGGQASPQDSGTQNEKIRAGVKSALSVKAVPGKNDALQVDRLMQRFFKRQRAAVLSRLGEKDSEWWDEERWDGELADDLYGLFPDMTQAAAVDMLERAGFSPDDFNREQTLNFLKAVAERRAAWINETTRDQIEAILAGEGPEGVTSAAHVFDVAESARAEQIAVTIAGTLAAFATFEAGKQTGASTKTWVTMSTSPRPAHAAMNGETVGIEDKFSNGANWPGDPVLGADGVSGCQCEVEVVF